MLMMYIELRVASLAIGNLSNVVIANFNEKCFACLEVIEVNKNRLAICGGFAYEIRMGSGVGMQACISILPANRPSCFSVCNIEKLGVA